ncbi:MAG: glycosyltransferase, partial [Candidatus Woesearchaeota archaeon]
MKLEEPDRNKRNVCIFFSTRYPYETTIKRELEVLSRSFDYIFYFPTVIKEGNKQTLPQNVILCTELADVRDEWKGLNIRQWITVIRLYLAHLFVKNNISAYLRHFKTYVTIAARNVLWKQTLAGFIKKNKLNNALLYDYWFENATLAISLLRRDRLINNAIAHAHRFDLYDEVDKTYVIPFREIKIKYIDKVYPIAEHGYHYLRSKVKDKFQHKIELAHLGVEIPKKITKVDPGKNYKLIVSVSNTQTFKRVHIIPDVLSQINIDINIKWLHFGIGPNDTVIKEKIDKLPPNISAKMMGYVPNNEVLNFYKENPVDLFVSLSLSEGLPISMMESVAYGIPVFACNVCGIPDLVTQSTGALFESEDDIITIANKLRKALLKRFNHEVIHVFANKKFDYKKNYSQFAKRIISLT